MRARILPDMGFAVKYGVFQGKTNIKFYKKGKNTIFEQNWISLKNLLFILILTKYHCAKLKKKKLMGGFLATHGQTSINLED